MLRNQTKKQSSFYVCASCRRLHHHDLAQLRSVGRIRTTSLSSTSRPFSSISATVLVRPAMQGQRNGAQFNGVLSRTTRADARPYSNWGRFGSSGQSNTAWGTSPNSIQSAGTPKPSPAWGGGASNIPSATGMSAWGRAGRTPPATGTSSWGGASNIPPAPGTSAGGVSGRTPQIPSAPSSFVPRLPDNPTSTPYQSSTKPTPQRTSVAPDAMNSASPSLGSTSTQPLNNSWGKSAPGAFPPRSGNPPGANSRNAVPGAPALGSQLGAVSSKPTFGGPAGWTPGKPMFEASSAWTPGKAAPSAWSKPAQSASADSATTPRKSTSGLDATTWKQSGSIHPSPAPKNLGAQSTNKAASQASTASRTKDLLLDTRFTRPPIRKPPPGAEFPQLQRRSSRDDMFEAMSPFKLPSKKEWPKHNTPAPGFAQNAITPELPSYKSPSKDIKDGQLPRRDRYPDWGATTKSRSSTRADRPSPEATERGSSDLSRPSKSQDQFELMGKSAFAQKKQMKTFDQASWSEGPLATGSSQPTRSKTDQKTTLSEGTRGARDSDRAIDSPTRGRGSGRETRDYKERGRDAANFSSRDGYAARDKTNKRRKFGGVRKQNIDENEGIDDYEAYEAYREAKAMRKQRQWLLDEERAAEEAAAPKTIHLPEYITVYDLAQALRIKPARFLHDLEQLGFENTLSDSVMTGETAALVAAEYGFEPTVESGAKVDLRPRPPPEDLTSVPPRPPIVTIMGHVDHGKTTILDTLRKSSVVAQEFGGITQHIGAFSVRLSTGKTITFLDTPGHAAFLSMRQRGANVTDIVVLVVAVDDSVKPQTIEAIKHAQSAKVPMIVAINKIDIDNTPNRIDMVKQDLANNGVELEDYGGDVQTVAISGRTGQGMRDLEDVILTLSEVLDMRAETDGMAEGWVLEASIKPDGRAATILVKRGTLRIGDLIVAGTAYTKVRIMRNEAGVDVEEAGPGTPIEIYGSWKGEPMAGDMVLQAPDEPKAQAAVDYRQEIAERAIAAAQNAEREAQDREKTEREALKKKLEEAEAASESEDAEAVQVGPKIVGIIVKGDVMGSVEAVSTSIQEIGNNEVRPRILRASPGQITESDVDHMATAKGAIVNFNAAIPAHILQRANNAGVVILDHNIIYETVQAVKDLLSAQLQPIYTQRVLAEAQVAKIFPINIVKRKYKNIAGVKVTNGKVTRGGQYRLMRDGEEVYKGKLAALKQNKDDVSEVRKGMECGMMFDEFDDFREGDLMQLYEDVEQPRYL